MALLAIAVLGLIVPNGFLIYWLLYEYEGVSGVVQNRLAVAFILDALMAMVVLAWRFARRPIGRVGWYWFVVLSLLGGLGFSIPFYWWLNGRGASAED